MKNINIETIRIDGGTQSRAELNEAAVAEYAQSIKGGAALPPVVVFFDGTENWLADGFHRYHAYRAAERASIPAEVHAGTLADAQLHSYGANKGHGLQRTNEDKRNAVMGMLSQLRRLERQAHRHARRRLPHRSSPRCATPRSLRSSRKTGTQAPPRRPPRWSPIPVHPGWSPTPASGGARLQLMGRRMPPRRRSPSPRPTSPSRSAAFAPSSKR